MADYYGPMEEDHFAQYEDQGEPIDGMQIADLRARVADMAARHELLVQQLNDQRDNNNRLQQQYVQQQADQVRDREVRDHARHLNEKMPDCPKIGSSDPSDNAKITPKQFTVYWRKVEVWLVLVQDRLPVERRGPTVAHRLEGQAADTVWLGINSIDDLANPTGVQLIRQLLENLYYGDQAAIVSGHLDDVFSYQKKSNQDMQEYISELRTKFQLLDGRGEVMPERTRGNLLLKNSGISESQRALVLATTQRNMNFNAVADALNLLFGDSAKRVHVDTHSQHSYVTQETEIRGRNAGRAKPKAKSGPCWNCNKPGHLMKDCFTPKKCFKCKSPSHLGKDCKSQQMQAMVAREPDQSRGSTNSTEERLNQLENLLLRANFTFVAIGSECTEKAFRVVRMEDHYTSAIVDPGCTSNVVSEGWLRCFEARSGQQFPRQLLQEGQPSRVFVFGAGDSKVEQYRVELTVDLFNNAKYRTTIVVSVVSGSQTPLLISRTQLAKWKALIDVEANKLTIEVNGQRVAFICPDTKSKLMILPILQSPHLAELVPCEEDGKEQKQ